MNKFKIIPLEKSLADKIRNERMDSFGHEVVEEIATGVGPCRLSLKPFNPGIDKRLLFLHSPFEKNNAFNQNGPVFIDSKEVEPYADIYKFPIEIKKDKVNFPLTLIGYNSNQKMVFSKLVGNEDVDDLIANIFDTETEVEYLHARNSEPCCFICRIDRV